MQREGKRPYYVLNGNLILFVKDRLQDIDGELKFSEPLTDIWLDTLPNDLHNEGGVKFRKGKKPEKLISRLIRLSTQEGDWVLDSFLGSGTTAGVALKAKRKFIGIEFGDHAYSHCIPRLKNTIDNKDSAGVTNALNWQGGGGFKFYELAPSLLNKDQYDNWVISKEYNANMLAAAMAKQEGFSYSPNTENYWKQGFSSEQDFIYTTTQFVTVELLDQLHDQLQEGDSLLICAKKFQPECANRFSKISLKKIPQMLLGKCEFAKDDYSLNIINLPQEDDINETEEDLENE
jgi:adenine-specific DNA-methyltransferase